MHTTRIVFNPLHYIRSKALCDSRGVAGTREIFLRNKYLPRMGIKYTAVGVKVNLFSSLLINGCLYCNFIQKKCFSKKNYYNNKCTNVLKYLYLYKKGIDV